MKKSYKEVFANEWIQTEKVSVFGEPEEPNALKFKSSYFRVLLVFKETCRKFWTEISSGRVERIVEVTKAKFYDDTKNEKYVFVAAHHPSRSDLLYLEDPNRSLIADLINTVEELGMVEEEKQVPLIIPNPLVVRNDIQKIKLMTNITIELPKGYNLVEEKDFLKLYCPITSKVIKEFVKISILGLYVEGNENLVINPKAMFKL